MARPIDLRSKSDFGKVVCKSLADKNMTQKQLASSLGMEYTYINSILCRKRQPSLKSVVKISAALELDLAYTFSLLVDIAG